MLSDETECDMVGTVALRVLLDVSICGEILQKHLV